MRLGDASQDPHSQADAKRSRSRSADRAKQRPAVKVKGSLDEVQSAWPTDGAALLRSLWGARRTGRASN